MGMHWWVTSVWQASPMLLVSWIFWVITSIVLHELGHGYAAIRLGDNTPLYTGHMTWNPMVHMGQTALIMFALFGFTWGAMPVNPSHLRGRYGEAIVAFAGPLCNAMQFVVLTFLNVVWIKLARGQVEEHVYLNVYTFFWAGSMINLMGFVFNLIPIPPLDGSRILGDFFPSVNRMWRSEHGAIIGMVAFALMFMVGGGIVWGFVSSTNQNVLDALLHALGTHAPRSPY